MSQQNILRETDDLSAFIEHCFEGEENEIVAQLVRIDVPEMMSCQEIDLVVK
ncbi:hypothetical protein BGZ50_007700 [Haplosporangium sp. Z 11]|nr:hypothetical protein BGZ50_007700 [Haplosporangium sp. Z 11]